MCQVPGVRKSKRASTSLFLRSGQCWLALCWQQCSPILNDAEVRSLERLLRVKAKVEDQGLPARLSGRSLTEKTPVSIDANNASCDEELSESPGRLLVRQSELSRGFRGDSGHVLASPSSDDCEGDLGHGCASPSADFREVDGGGQVAPFAGGSEGTVGLLERPAHAAASESGRNLGSRQVIE